MNTGIWLADPSEARTVWRYQRGNQNPYIEEEQTTKWLKEIVQKDKQRSTKHTHKTKDRVTRTPLNRFIEGYWIDIIGMILPRNYGGIVNRCRGHVTT